MDLRDAMGDRLFLSDGFKRDGVSLVCPLRKARLTAMLRRLSLTQHKLKLWSKNLADLVLNMAD